MTLIQLTDMADEWRMDENLTSKASYRISGKSAHVGRVSNPSIRDRMTVFPTDF
jgi:hypothetical protein